MLIGRAILNVLAAAKFSEYSLAANLNITVVNPIKNTTCVVYRFAFNKTMMR